MKLIRLRLDQPYKSLAPFELLLRSPEGNDPVQNVMGHHLIAPICLVGPNGAGKSNLLEFLAEVFCYLDLLHLPYQQIKKTARRFKASFEIDYSLPSEGRPANEGRVTVRIAKKGVAAATFQRRTPGGWELVRRTEETAKLLPTKIVGYTSGLNETLSFPFLRVQSLYSAEVSNRANPKRPDYQTSVPESRSMFLDYESNASILLANYLCGSRDQLDVFSDALRLSDIASFKIVLNFKLRRSANRVRLTPELKSYVDKLRACALLPPAASESEEEEVVLNYVVDDVTRAAFRRAFGTPHGLFAALHKLSLLNALALPKQYREWQTRKGGELGLLTKPPTVVPEDRFYRIDSLRLRLHTPAKVIDYIGISDGEHQFIQIVGTVLLMDSRGAIFLLDEPDTHFNPQWRAKLVTSLNKVVSGRDQEYVISTHSPFVVSDCQGQNVLRFVREGSLISIAHTSFETFGASFQYILVKLFGMRHSISQQALAELQRAIDSNDQEVLVDAAARFGESSEKQYLYQAIARANVDVAAEQGLFERQNSPEADHPSGGGGRED